MSLSTLAFKANLDSECCGQAGWGERAGLSVDSSFRTQLMGGLLTPLNGHFILLFMGLKYWSQQR